MMIMPSRNSQRQHPDRRRSGGQRQPARADAARGRLHPCDLDDESAGGLRAASQEPLRPDPARPADARHGRLPGDGRPQDQRRRRYLPVIVLTAQPGHKLRALQAGAKDFISKPFDLVEVKTRIHNMLEVRLLYKKLENYNKVLEQTVQERTAELRESEARYRSLTELASDWYWEQDENGTSPRFPARCWRCSASASTALAGDDRRRDDDGWNEASARRCRRRSPRASPSSISSSAASTPTARSSSFRVSGEPMFNRPAASSATAESAWNSPRGRQHPDAAMHRSIARIQNHLLAALPTAEFERLAAHLELVPLPLGEMLYEPGEQLQHAYFPTTAIVSLHYVTGVRRIGRKRGRRQRRRGRHFAVHGRRHHAELGRRADRRPRLPAGARLLKQEFDRAGLLQRCCCATRRR
jgi:CheY-like chemotaxis protein